MDIVIEQINSAGKAFVDFAWPMLWQASVLIAILLAVDWLLRRKVRAVFRYWLWMLVLAKLFLPTTLSSPVSIGLLTGNALPAINIAAIEQPVGGDISTVLPHSPRTAETGKASITLHAEAPIQSQAITQAVSLTREGGIFLAWLMVICAMLLLLMQRAVFVCGLVRQSAEATGLMKDALKFCCNQMGVRQTIGLKISPNATSPAVCGLFRPVILVPQGLGSSLGISSVRVVLMHELAHIKRGDLWVNLLQTLLQIAYFYNPLLWVANWVIRRVREQAVDEAVQVALGERAQQYPETLLNVARLAFERPALSLRLIGVVESKGALTSRIKRMLTRPIPKTAKLGIIGSLVIIILAAVLLPMAKAAPPPEFVIKGTVTDVQTGQPIAGAKVGDVDEYAGGKQSVLTDANGNYSYKSWYEEHNVKCEASNYKTETKVIPTKIFGAEREKVLDFAISSKKNGDDEFKAALQPIDFKITGTKFLNGDSITIADLSGPAGVIRPGQTYVVSGRYTLKTHDDALLYIYATNGETQSSQGPSIKQGEGQFTRTFTLLKEGDLHLSFYPLGGGESFGGVYFAQIGADAGTEAVQKTGAEVVDVAVEDFNISPYPAGGLYTVTVSIRNRGRAESPKFGVNFYRGDPNEVKPMIHEAGPIKPGDVWREGSMPFALKEGANEIAVLLDPDNTLGESDRTNNEASMKVVVKDGKIVEKKVSLSSAHGIGKETTGISDQVINAAEFGDTNGTNAGKNNRMSKPEKTGGQTRDEQSRGEEIVKRMAEVNRYWLIGPPVAVKNYSYDFALYQDEPHTYKVTEPSSADRAIRQGITYDSLLHKLAKEPFAATYTSIEEVNGIIRADFKLKESIQISMGNGLRGSWYGSFNQPVEGGTFWIDAKKMLPVRAKCNEVYEYFSDYAAVDETHYVPLRVKIDKNDMPMRMHFNWTFKLHKPGLWLFDESHYSIDENKSVVAASISNVRVNGELSDQSSGASADVNKPRIISVWPKDGATEVEPATEIRLRFDRPMNPDQTNLRFKEGRYRNFGTVRYDESLREFVMPVELEAGTKYRIILNEWSSFRKERQKGFVDTNGMDAEEYEWSFSTKGVVKSADLPKPKIVSVNPASGLKIALVSELKIVFDQPITAHGFKLGLPDKSSWPREPLVFCQNVRYNADKTEFTVPLTLPPNWNGTIELSGFVNTGGVEAEPISLQYSTGREVFSPELLLRLKDAAKSQKLIDVLEAVRNKRLNIKSLSETVQTVSDFGKSPESTRAIFKMQGDRQFFADITGVMNGPFFVGSNGKDCWFYYKGEKEELVMVPFEQVQEKTVSICDFAGLSKSGVTKAIEDYKLEYVGEDVLDGRKCHLIRSWSFGLEKDYLLGSVNVGWIDAQTNMLVQVIDDSGFLTSIYRFSYDRINEVIPDSEFSPKSLTDIKLSAPEPLNDKYDTRILRIMDGSSGRMEIRWGEKGPGGTRSSGLN
jgi:beta-lactamase regulating signal transducer with metallopeptidase domain/outer membrane lipoprotein-sorting protein